MLRAQESEIKSYPNFYYLLFSLSYMTDFYTTADFPSGATNDFISAGTIRGEKCASNTTSVMAGQTCKSISIYVETTGSYDVDVKITNGSSFVYEKSFTSQSITADTPYALDISDNTHSFVSGDAIGVSMDSGKLKRAVWSSGSYNAEVSVRCNINSSASIPESFPESDMWFIMSTEAVPSTSTVFPPPPIAVIGVS